VRIYLFVWVCFCVCMCVWVYVDWLFELRFIKRLIINTRSLCFNVCIITTRVILKTKSFNFNVYTVKKALVHFFFLRVSCSTLKVFLIMHNKKSLSLIFCFKKFGVRISYGYWDIDVRRRWALWLSIFMILPNLYH